MSILIKGVEMPNDGYVCLKVFANGEVLLTKEVRSALVITGIKDKVGTAVPVPPHGDLVDQDAYRDEFMSGVYDLCNDDPDNYRANSIIDLFDSAPTIIPAEEGE